MRKMKTPLCLLALTGAMLALFAGPSRLWAQMPADLEPGQHPGTFVNAGSFFQPEAHAQGGGNVTVARYSLAAGSSLPVNDKVAVRFGFSYDLDDYKFSRLSGFTAPNPWGQINRIGVSAGVMYRVSPVWSLFASPVVQYAGEEGADFGDSLLWGATMGALYKPGKTFAIGFGGGVFRRLEGTSFFPAFIFSWNITDKLRLGNSFVTGPSGPAGLELAYALDSDWETAVGGGFRSYRFRLDRSGPVPDGIGQSDSWPLFARLSRKFGPHFRADIYGGAAFGGRLTLDNSHGHNIDHISYNTAPIAGFSLTMLY
jgi:hypothetical protein